MEIQQNFSAKQAELDRQLQQVLQSNATLAQKAAAQNQYEFQSKENDADRKNAYAIALLGLEKSKKPTVVTNVDPLAGTKGVTPGPKEPVDVVTGAAPVRK